MLGRTENDTMICCMLGHFWSLQAMSHAVIMYLLQLPTVTGLRPAYYENHSHATSSKPLSGWRPAAGRLQTLFTTQLDSTPCSTAACMHCAVHAVQNPVRPSYGCYY